MSRLKSCAPFLGCLILFLMGSFFSAAPINGADRFPFHIPGDDVLRTVTDFSGYSHRPAGAGGFVHIRDGHFHTALGRLKLWGVNICFGANFPSRDESEKIAAHLAKLGVNGVRLHFFDHAPAPAGILGPVADGRRELDPVQLDRQDYFLDQLHRNGIYVNINLHVGRTFSEAEGFVQAGMPREARFNKYVLYYEPRMRERFKSYCRSLLTHHNPYRKMRRVDDPAIAMVEITNENKFSRQGPELALSLPESYQVEFKRQWNQWLRGRYADTGRLYRAWARNLEPPGVFIVTPAEWTRSLAPWALMKSDTGSVDVLLDQDGPRQNQRALRIFAAEQAPAALGPILQIEGLSMKNGRTYTLAFWAQTSTPQTVQLTATAGDLLDSRPVGLDETVMLSTSWQRHVLVFKVEASVSDTVRIAFGLDAVQGELKLSQVSLRHGGEWTIIPAGQSLGRGNLGIPVNGWSDNARADIHRFMVDTEQDFIRDMKRFIKADLGVRVPVTASQVNYHGAAIAASTCDYIDIHAYWQHPYFPRRHWDKTDWLIGNTPLEAASGFRSLLECAPWRMFDRPFTLSEWNIAEPNDYAASAVPFAAMIAALQDWDGVFFYNYYDTHRDPFTDRIRGFFPFNGQPAKLALLTACANWYRRGDIAPLKPTAAGTLKQKLHHTHSLAYRIGIDPGAPRPAVMSPPTGNRLATPDRRAVWDASNPAKPFVRINTPASRAVWGLIGGRTFRLGGIELNVGPVTRNYAVVVFTSLDGQPLEQSDRILLAAVGSAANRGMVWNSARTSVGDLWGDGPALVNGIAAEMTLPFRASQVFGLDGRGLRKSGIPLRRLDGKTRFNIGPENRTLWYEIVP